MTRREIARKFDTIVDFAEVERFLDTPVKHYSSGMYVRLAFAVASNLNPEILVVDEVLAVGDVAFQKKCLGKMTEVSRSGRTVLFVSHNMATVEKLCQHGVVLDQGKMVFSGTSKDSVQHYLSSVSGCSQGQDDNYVDLTNASGRKRGSRELLRRLEFFGENDEPVNGGIRTGDNLKLKVHFNLENPTDSFNVGIGFNTMMGFRVFTAHSFFEPDRSHGEKVGPQVFVCDIPSFPFLAGEYSLKIWLDVNSVKADEIEDAARVSVVQSDYYGTGKAPWNGAVVINHRWYLEEPSAIPVEDVDHQETRIT
jgi:lipopolysaccharide transport system ATP-binding protein